MTRHDDLLRLGACGCCETGAATAERYNRHGQPSLAYRLGTHVTFLQRLLSHLPRQRVPSGPNEGLRPLSRLTTRSTDDPAIALLDASAIIGDVLTFYQERIANEGYLLTATERRSVLEMARSIGYELSPGVAASTHLAFSVEEAPELPTGAATHKSPTATTVPKGTRVKSVPGPEESSQTFETVEEIEARAEWNELCPQQSRAQYLALDDDGKLYLVDPAAPLGPGEGETIADLYFLGRDVTFAEGATRVEATELRRLYLKGTTSSVKPGDLLLLVGEKRDSKDVKTETERIARVEPEPSLDRTRIDLEAGALSPVYTAITLAISGAFATMEAEEIGFSGESVGEAVLRAAWRESDLEALVTYNRWDESSLVAHAAAARGRETTKGVFAFGQRAGFFGHNAPWFSSLPVTQRTDTDIYNNKDWDEGEGRTIWQDWKGDDYGDPHVYLERSLPEVLADSWVVFESGDTRQAYRVNSTVEESLIGFALTGKATGLSLEEPDGDAPNTNTPDFRVRKTTAHVQSEEVQLAELPIEDEIAVGTTELTLDGMVLGLQPGRSLIISGERDDADGVTASEVVTLRDVYHLAGRTTLVFEKGLQYPYVRKTAKLNGNVARATHGETAYQLLGFGDATQPNQRFELKSTPLTYVSAPTSSGRESTLELRVNGVRRKELPSLYGVDEGSESYMTRINDDGKTYVTLGGARAPTGAKVEAIHRTGTGLQGEVEPDTLTLLQTRPLGVRDVTNPPGASGAEAPEKLADAARNAPLTVLTLDRIVSLRDYEDFAAAFAGVGKARAAAIWDSDQQLVHVTIASASGREVDPSSDLYTDLVDAIDAASDTLTPVRVDSYRSLLFYIEGRLRVDQRYRFRDVRDRVEAALKSEFSFERRSFGQPVTAAEVVRVIHEVPGVVAVDIDNLYRVTDATGYNSILRARTARLDESGRWQGAEMLTLHPAGVTLENMESQP